MRSVVNLATAQEILPRVVSDRARCTAWGSEGSLRLDLPPNSPAMFLELVRRREDIAAQAMVGPLISGAPCTSCTSSRIVGGGHCCISLVGPLISTMQLKLLHEEFVSV